MSANTRCSGAYQDFGRLTLTDMENSRYARGTTTDYLLQLDLETAVATASWTAPDGTHYTKEYIASHPDGCIAVRMTASKPAAVSLRVTLMGTHDERTTYSGREATMGTRLETVSGRAVVRVENRGGSVSAYDDGLWVSGADECLIILCAGTDYDPAAAGYISGTSGLSARISERARQAAEKGWDIIKDVHVRDHASLFGRMRLTLDDAHSSLATDELIAGYATAKDTDRRHLEQLYFAYGRYLQIASSRGMAVPNNLQGIWNNSNNPPRTSDIKKGDESYNYIVSLVNKLERDILLLEKDPTNRDYQEVIDVNSFAKWYLVAELTTTFDPNLFYVLHDRTSKLEMYPMWDAEWSLGLWPMNWGASPTQDQILKAKLWTKKGFFKYLLMSPDFIKAVKTEWAKLRRNIPVIRKNVGKVAQSISLSQRTNYFRWPGQVGQPLNITFDTWDEEVRHIGWFFDERVTYMDSYINSL